MTPHILIADDDEATRELYLATYGDFSFDVASGGIQLLELAMAKPYRLILTDIGMPDINGIEAMRHIRDTPGPNRNTCICSLTGDRSDATARDGRITGFDAMFLKPIAAEKLIYLFRWADAEMPRFLFPAEDD